MKYPKEYLEEIKLRLKVSQVVSKSVLANPMGSFVYRKQVCHPPSFDLL